MTHPPVGCTVAGMKRTLLGTVIVAFVLSACVVKSKNGRQSAPPPPVSRVEQEPPPPTRTQPPPPAPEPAPAPEPPPPPPEPVPPPPPPQWSPDGWEMLGEATVNGKKDKDKLKVGKKAGSYTRIALVVVDSSLEMFDVVVKFGNGDKWSPDTRLVFAENDQSRVMDLPGDARKIKEVTFKYGNLAGGGKAKVQLWGKDVTSETPPPPPVAHTDTAGWEDLGTATVHGKSDKDEIVVGKKEGSFTKVMFVVEGSDLEMFDVVIKFGNDTKHSPDTKLVFKEGAWSRVIDLPGEARFIKKVTFKYGNLPGSGKATVRLFAK